jgi:hypothetical protein
MNLPWTKNKNTMAMNWILYKVNLMNTLTIMNGKNEKEIVFVKVVNKVFAVQHLLKVADTKPSCAALQRLGRSYMPDGYCVHDLKLLISQQRLIS